MSGMSGRPPTVRSNRLFTGGLTWTGAPPTRDGRLRRIRTVVAAAAGPGGAGPRLGSGRLLPRRPLARLGRVPTHDGRVHVVEHDLLGDHHAGDAVVARDVEHHRQQHLL